MPTSEVHNCDCLEFMRTLPDKFFDLAVADPPYGININESIGRRKGDKHSGRKKAEWDAKAPERAFFDELDRVAKEYVIWGANHFIESLPRRNASCWLLWDKKFSDEVDFSQFEMAWTSFNGMTKKFEMSPTTKEYKFHPTQKPVELYGWILKRFAPPRRYHLRPYDGQSVLADCGLQDGVRLCGLRAGPGVLCQGL